MVPSRRPGTGEALLLALLTLYSLGHLASTGWWLLAGSPQGDRCQLDNEGSWSIGIFKGSSPFSLQPLEGYSPSQDTAVAWPAANPVLTCASVSDSPSNFVADPFLLRRDDSLYMFYETKSSQRGKGEIGVAVSADDGRSFRHLATVLTEPWHLSYPLVFEHGGEVYMLPEGSASGKLFLYRSIDFPLKWQRLPTPLINRPLVDASLVQWQSRWYLFASDHTRRGARANGELEIWHAESPLGPWQQHALNPVVRADRSGVARSGGRPFVHDGQLYRWAQDCGATYGHHLAALQVTALSPTEFEQRHVAHNISGLPREPPLKQGWNSERHHHVDLLQLAGGEWVAAMDGDSLPSGPVSAAVLRALALAAAPWLLVAAAYAVAHVLSRQRGLLRRWVIRGAATGARSGYAGGAWRVLLVAPLVRAAQRSKRMAGSKSSSPDFARRERCSDLEDGESPTATAGEADTDGVVCLMSPRGLGCDAGLARLSPVHVTKGWEPACVVSPRQVSIVASASPLVALTSPFSGSNGGSTKLRHSHPRGHTPRRQSSSRRGFRGTDLQLRQLALAAVATAMAVGTALAYGYAAPYLQLPRPEAVDGQYSQFTLLVMTYEARMGVLRPFIAHYSRCASVSDIVLVWNKGRPPLPERDFDSAVPVRVRVERHNSLNNRFKQDPLITNRAVLSLDDDIMMPCQDIERGFAEWRRTPEKMVGFFPRLIEGEPQLVFRGERYSVERGAYNAVLTGAAFIDTRTALPAYWDDSLAPARDEVDRVFNGEDLLMNFVLANRTRAVQALHASLQTDASAAAATLRAQLERAFFGSSSDGSGAHFGAGVGGAGVALGLPGTFPGLVPDGTGLGLARLGLHAHRSQKGLAQQLELQQQRRRQQLERHSEAWPAVEFVRPTRRLDISKLSGVGISHNWLRFKAAAHDYLQRFTDTFGYVPLRQQALDWGDSGPPFCAVGFLGCVYL